MIRRTKSALHFRELIETLELSQMAAARFLRRGPRSIRRWVAGDDEPPFAERALLEVMIAEDLSPEAVEEICGRRD
jgi:DNA-binding transcriptional regulator YiaG